MHAEIGDIAYAAWRKCRSFADRIGGASGATVGALTAEDRVYVQQYVYSRQVEPVVVQQGLVVGQPVPAGVSVYAFEGNPRLASYRYAYVNQQYVLVDSNGRVVGSIER